MKKTERRRAHDSEWRTNRALLLRLFPVCEVPECRSAARTVHHMRNGGMGKRNHGLKNLMALCARHHTGADGVDSSMGRDTWARRFFRLSYADLCVHVAETREEDAGGS